MRERSLRVARTAERSRHHLPLLSSVPRFKMLPPLSRVRTRMAFQPLKNLFIAIMRGPHSMPIMRMPNKNPMIIRAAHHKPYRHWRARAQGPPLPQVPLHLEFLPNIITIHGHFTFIKSCRGDLTLVCEKKKTLHAFELCSRLLSMLRRVRVAHCFFSSYSEEAWRSNMMASSNNLRSYQQSSLSQVIISMST